MKSEHKGKARHGNGPNFKKKDGSKRNTPVQANREKLRVDVMTLYLKGHSMRGIQHILSGRGEGRTGKVAVSTIQHLVNDALAEWRQEKLQIIDDHRAVEIAKINSQEAALWKAWDASCVQNGGTGDVKYMEAIGKCTDRRNKLLGYDVPVPTLNIQQNNISQTENNVQVNDNRRMITTQIVFSTRKAGEQAKTLEATAEIQDNQTADDEQ